ncbi:hypothetical protein LWI28_017547 [Acer negundo]|uniref:DUF4283 domain-containing protein n=1 Tax=Acer negundo TaxID=4023 RepID=A0AAD5IV73_ACENE|nr:hypothetical protein LWI28_017547 [Acer negundo]
MCVPCTVQLYNDPIPMKSDDHCSVGLTAVRTVVQHLDNGFGFDSARPAEGFKHQAETDRTEKGFSVARKEQAYNGTKTFVEILRENRGMKREQVSKESKQGETERVRIKESTMSWSSHQREELWLRRCAVSVLKSFSNVECVSDRLKSRGFNFTSRFVGTKSVLWCFNLELENEGFINNIFLWEDRFVLMRNWSDIPSSHLRMAWILCTEIPLCHWSFDFFFKLGWVIGEPLLVDEATAFRKRLDRGRILVLVNQEKSVSAKVKVEVGK